MSISFIFRRLKEKIKGGIIDRILRFFRPAIRYCKHVLDLYLYLKTCPHEKNKILLTMVPVHGNIGDQFIKLAEYNFFQKYIKDRTIDVVSGALLTSKNSWILHFFKKYYSLVIIHGGGFLGTLWPYEEKNFRSIIKVFHNKRIIIFPQTVFYDDENELNIARKIYRKCKNMSVFIRDESINFTREKLLAGLNIPVFNVPDIVLSLNYSEHSTEQNGLLFCLRHDKEKVSDDKAINRIQSLCKQNGYSLKLTDTVVNHDVEEDNVKKECENKIAEFQKSKLVITDRLHGMILSVIAGIPCIALNNISKKVQGVWNLWLKDRISYVYFAENADVIDEVLINKMISMGAQKYNPEIFDEYWDIIGENIGTEQNRTEQNNYIYKFSLSSTLNIIYSQNRRIKMHKQKVFYSAVFILKFGGSNKWRNL